MQRREDYRIDCKKVVETGWVPAPRECATLTACGYKLYLIGGINYDAIKEVIQARIVGDHVQWEKVPYTSREQINGRQCHTSVTYNNKVYTFGGCFMYNKER